MRIDIITAFPEYFEAPLAASIMGRAVKKELISVRIHDLRDYTEDRHRQIDDYPYGGGAGICQPSFLKELFVAARWNFTILSPGIFCNLSTCM